MLSASDREAVLEGLTDKQLDELQYDWKFWARPDQLPPEMTSAELPWSIWLILAGRGFGKTRTGAEWVRMMVESREAARLAIVAEDAADARDVMVEGESGILNTSPPSFKPTYEPSKRRLTWPNGAVATLFSADDPDALRGPQFDAAWCDELAKWRYAADAWNNLQFALRLGNRPRQCITTTPRPIPLLREIMARKDTAITRGSTYDNRANLAPTFFESIIRRYEGTRLGRQELQAEMLEETYGALWNRTALDHNRRKPGDLPEMKRVVVGIDPAINAPDDEQVPGEGAETGVIAVGLGVDERGYVLGDYSGRWAPADWAKKAIAALDRFNGDLIVAETNQGGEMVKSTIRAIRPNIKVLGVKASKGKVTRAEPVAALYEQNRISHVGSFPQLEDQMMLFTVEGVQGTSGDRVDALVWAITQLFPQMVKVRERTALQIEGIKSYNPQRF